MLLDQTTIVAVGFDQIIDGTLDAPINRDEANNTISSITEVWTGTDSAGVNNGLFTCGNWTSNSSGSGRTGLLVQNNANWTSTANLSCIELRRLYCFQR